LRFFELLDDVHVFGRWHLGEIYAGESTPVLLSGAPACGPLHADVTDEGLPLDYCITSFAVPVARAVVAAAIESVAGKDIQSGPSTTTGRIWRVSIGW
jgi:hypothetical protein